MSYDTRSWRSRAAAVIRRVLHETKDQPEDVIKAALFAAYPFGQRANHPYKIWLDEIQRQRKKRPPLGTRQANLDPRQAALFPEVR